jgi:hypothetical protein
MVWRVGVEKIGALFVHIFLSVSPTTITRQYTTSQILELDEMPDALKKASIERRRKNLKLVDHMRLLGSSPKMRI